MNTDILNELALGKEKKQCLPHFILKINMSSYEFTVSRPSVTVIESGHLKQTHKQN